MNKCDGIKILELDPKRNLEGSEYMVVAEKDQNYKAPIKQYKTWNDQTNVDGDIIIGSVRCLNTDTMTEEGQIKVIAMNENGTIYNDSISTAFRYGYVAGNSEKRGQQFIRSYVSSRDGQAADEEFAVVNYFDKTEAGQVVALNPIT